jgi:5-methylcytosine-specific restriction endonuclease McrA
MDVNINGFTFRMTFSSYFDDGGIKLTPANTKLNDPEYLEALKFALELFPLVELVINAVERDAQYNDIGRVWANNLLQEVVALKPEQLRTLNYSRIIPNAIEARRREVRVATLLPPKIIFDPTNPNTTPKPKGLRISVLAEYNSTCQECGKSYQDLKRGQSELHVHHITPTKWGGSHDMDNLTLLCASCHGKKHQEIMRVQDEYGYRNGMQS